MVGVLPWELNMVLESCHGTCIYIEISHAKLCRILRWRVCVCVFIMVRYFEGLRGL